MAVDVNRVVNRDIHANLNQIACLQIGFRFTKNIHLIGNRDLRDDAFIHTALEQHPCVSGAIKYLEGCTVSHGAGCIRR